jgi:phosphoribosylformylglycinamidine cyclo-ligase
VSVKKSPALKKRKKKVRAAAPAAPRPRGSYATSGVNTAQEESGLKSLVALLQDTLQTRPAGLGHVKLPFGYFANVVEVGGIGIAISTDGVGSKLLVAQMVGKYDTLGIDCVAMNVNDLLCVGAEPISMVDYIAVQEPDPFLLTELAKGLRAGALTAGITIPGGEIAQVRDIIKGVRPGLGFDLAGTAIGTVPLDQIRIGRDIEPDDVVLGLASSGIHSNGMTLARGLFKKLRPSTRLKEIGRTLGEELLEPTRIYVKEVLDVLRSGVDVKALIHVTSDGLLNLLRVDNGTGYVIHSLPDAPRIFDVIRRELRVSLEEMYRVYNMGVGFCLVVSHRGDHAARAQQILKRHGVPCCEIGRAVSDPAKAVIVEPAGLRGADDRFTRI